MDRAAEHEAMIQIAANILNAARSRGGADVVEIAHLRLSLSRTIAAHLEREAAEVLPADRQDLSPTVRDMIAAYHDGMLAWRRALMLCNAAWPLDAIREDARGFEAAFAPLYDQLVDRVYWEDMEFFPNLHAMT